MLPVRDRERKEINRKLLNRFGFELPSNYLLFKKKNEYYILNKEIPSNLSLRIERKGVKILAIEPMGIRLTMTGVQLFKNLIKKNVVEVSDSKGVEFLAGIPIEVGEVEAEEGFVVVRSKRWWIGCGYYKNGVIKPWIPKERRIPEKHLERILPKIQP